MIMTMAMLTTKVGAHRSTNSGSDGLPFAN
jgi:hypothetical protein